ncbi:nucleoside-diphosphate kinase [Pseudoneobacillus sp. C159]
MNWNNIGFVICKPDAVYLNLEQDILAYLQENGFEILASKYVDITPDLCQRLYWNDDDYEPAWWWKLETEFFNLGESLCVIVQGKPRHPYRSVSEEINQKWKGNNKPELAQQGSIRHKFGSMNRIFNLFHSSDSSNDAKREALLFFSNEEINHLENRHYLCKFKQNDQHSLDLVDLYFRLKMRCLQRATMDTRVRHHYTTFIEEKIQQSKGISQAKRQIWLYETLQEEYRQFFKVLRENKLLKYMTDYRLFHRVNFDALLPRVGLDFSKWESCLLKTTLLIPPKNFR